MPTQDPWAAFNPQPASGGIAPAIRPLTAPQPAKPTVRQVGNSLGIVDPNTGGFTPTYTAPETPKEPKGANLGQGYMWAPDGKTAMRIPGIKVPGSAIPVAVASDYEGKVSAFGALERAVNSFKPDYAGAGSGIESIAQGFVGGIGTPGQRDWWADFKQTDNISRNALFGASLSSGEKAAFAETTITRDMDPAEVQRNLTRRLEIARKVLGRKRSFLVANGYDEGAVSALDGGLFTDGSQGASPGPMNAGGGGIPEGNNPKGFRMSEAQSSQFTGYLKNNAASLTPESMSVAYQAITGQGLNPEKSQQVIDFIRKGGDPTKIGVDYSVTDAAATLDARRLAEAQGQAGVTDLIAQGATLGLSDEGAGIGNAAANIIASPFTDTEFDPVGAYTAGRDAERIRLNEARERMGAVGTALEIGGALFSGGAAAGARLATTLGGRILQGTKAGAAGGTIGGFGYGEGTQNSLLSAAGGAAIGSSFGAALPVAGQVISNRVGGLSRMMGRDPNVSRNLVGEAIGADGNTPRVVGEVMDQARGRGSPMMLADTGENTRELLASVGRPPGPARRLVREAVQGRQNAQSERISEAVVRDLGPTANIRELGDELITRANTEARPLYQAFESAAGASSVKLDDLAMRPSFRKALLKAANLAAEEGEDATALGFQFDAAGDVLLTEVPSFRTMDYIKKGLDDVVEGFRDGTTGRLNLNTGEARATNATLRTLIARIDKVNPAYAQARAAYAGPAAMRTAMEKGAKSLTKSPDDIMAAMRNMGDSEQEAYRLGIRKAITDLVASKRDGGDKVAALIGTPKSRSVLTRVFGGRAEFERFIQTLRDEEAMGLTYKAVAGNSATASRQAFDATTNDTGLAETVTDAALRGGKDGMWSAAVSAIQRLREVDRFGAGEAGQRAREGVAALLSETDPAVLRDIVQAALIAARQQRARVGRQGRNAVRVGRNAGDLGGMAIGRTTEQQR